MKNILFALLANATSIACVVGAIFLALNGIPGWGWFLIIALFTFSSISISGSE